MFRSIIAILIVAFTLASGGFQKLVDFSDISAIESSVSLQAPSDTQKCCASENTEHDFDNTRCIGENCINQVAALLNPKMLSSTLRMAPV